MDISTLLDNFLHAISNIINTITNILLISIDIPGIGNTSLLLILLGSTFLLILTYKVIRWLI